MTRPGAELAVALLAAVAGGSSASESAVGTALGALSRAYDTH